MRAQLSSCQIMTKIEGSHDELPHPGKFYTEGKIPKINKRKWLQPRVSNNNAKQGAEQMGAVKLATKN